MTPRAQLARVLVGATFAVLVGAGPAIAWDVSTQPPRAEAPSPWPHDSPWKTAGEHVKDAVMGIARVYLPRSAPSASQASAIVVPTLPPPAPPSPPSGLRTHATPRPLPSIWLE